MAKGKQIAVLNDDEVELLRLGREDPDYITDYFFRPKGASSGWKFDYQFDPEGRWQRTVHHAAQKRIVVIGGFGSGKTRGVAVSAAVWCMTVPDFAFLNAAPVSWQTELMYKFLLSISRGTPFERLIFSAPKRPYPVIELRFYVKNVLVVSTMEFMSVDKNASQILSWEGDWVNIDEAGLLDDLSGTLTNLSSRLRGSVNGRTRLGRLSIASNSWDNPELWYRYDLAASLPEDYLSLTVSTRHNKNVTEDQLRLMLKDIPEDEHQRFIDAARPEGKGIYFSKPKVYACEDKDYGDFIVAGAQNNVPGFAVAQVYGAGVVYFTVPAVSGHSYMLLGDPGTDDAPNRNAPVLMVWDVTDFPKYKASMVAVWWGAGRGSITPFIRNMLTFMSIYDPIFTAVDSTGPQKNTNELLNIYLLGGRTDPTQKLEWLGDIDMSKMTNPNIAGMDFSGGHKPAYLISARLMIEAGLMTWPKFFVGMRSQLTNYDPDKDRATTGPKLTQDLVAAFAMSTFAIRAWFSFDPALLQAEARAQAIELFGDVGFHNQRYPSDARELRLPSARI